MAYGILPVSVAPKRFATNRDRAIGDPPRAIAFCDGIVVDHAPGGSVGVYANAFRSCHDSVVIFHFGDDDICDVMTDRVAVAERLGCLPDAAKTVFRCEKRGRKQSSRFHLDHNTRAECRFSSRLASCSGVSG